MRVSYDKFVIGLDQIYSLPLSDGESAEDRCRTIDRYIESNGWDWESIIVEMAKTEVDKNLN